MVTAIRRYPGRLPKSWEAFFPLTRRSETMDATVRPIGDIDPPESVESEIKRFPRICQLRIRFFDRQRAAAARIPAAQIHVERTHLSR